MIETDKSFFKRCGPCKGTGELRSSHPLARNAQGYPTGYAYPVRTGGMSGEVIAEATRSICGACCGSGNNLIRNV